MYELREFTPFIVFFGLLGLATMIYKPTACNARWPEIDSKWSPFTGCMIKHEGRFIPEDRFWIEPNRN